MKRPYSQSSIEAQKRAAQAVKWAQQAVQHNVQTLENNWVFHRVFLQQQAIDRTHHLFQIKYGQLQRALEDEKHQPQTSLHKLKVALLHEQAQCPMDACHVFCQC